MILAPMGLAELVRPELIFADLTAGSRDEVLREVASRVAGTGAVPSAGELYRELVAREKLGTTAVGGGVAIPHCKLAKLREGVVALGLVPGGVDFGAADGQPVVALFVVVSPSVAPGEHLQVLAAISRWLRDADRAQREPAKILELFQGAS